MLPLKRWKILNEDPSLSAVDAILKNRNLPVTHLEKFRLSERLHDPFLMKDMQAAVKRILKAINNNEKIAIYGDYDVDGVVSTVLMVNFFQKLNYPVTFFIPDRNDEGYGLRLAGVNEALADKTNLLITVDNGISSNEAVSYAAKQGLDIIITDHHLQEADLPQAVAVLNPNRRDSEYPFKGLCGAGVVYKLIHALGPHFLNEDEFKKYMLYNVDLVTLAIIADMVPLIDENYSIAKYGLKALSDSYRPGIIELKKAAGIMNDNVTPVKIGYYMAPRLNAAGRISDARYAAKLLLSANLQEAKEIARNLNSLNTKRQKKQHDYLKQVNNYRHAYGIDQNKVIIVQNEQWESGLVGLISGQLKEKYNKPTLAFTKDNDGNYVGSCRSIEAFHITDALTRFSDLLLNYGGHHKAAGLTISADNYNEFRERFTAYANEIINDEDLIPDLNIDTVITVEQLNEATILTIEDIGPYGESNPEPVFVLKDAVIKDIRMLSNGKHIKFFVSKGSARLECVWWGKGEMKDELRFDMRVDIAFKPNINIWNGRRTIQLVVEDVREAEMKRGALGIRWT